MIAIWLGCFQHWLMSPPHLAKACHPCSAELSKPGSVIHVKTPPNSPNSTTVIYNLDEVCNLDFWPESHTPLGQPRRCTAACLSHVLSAHQECLTNRKNCFISDQIWQYLALRNSKKNESQWIWPKLQCLLLFQLLLQFPGAVNCDWTHCIAHLHFTI
jgi:hypothetical protein